MFRSAKRALSINLTLLLVLSLLVLSQPPGVSHADILTWSKSCNFSDDFANSMQQTSDIR